MAVSTCLGITQETPKKLNSKHKRPQIICIKLVKEQVIHQFPTVLANAISVDNINIPPQIIQSENLSPRGCPSKKKNLLYKEFWPSKYFSKEGHVSLQSLGLYYII